MSIWWSQWPLCCTFLLLSSMLMAQQQVITPVSIPDSTAKTCKELSRFTIVIGCPPKPKNRHFPSPFKLERKNLKLDSVVILKKIEFDLNSSDLKSNTDRALQEVCDFLKANSDISVEIGAHTSSNPSRSYADTLTTRRAKAVANWLTSHGVPQECVEYRGYGWRNYIADNETAEGRKKNTRIEMKIIAIKQ